MALELVIVLKNPILIKRTISELFSFTLPFLSFEPRPAFINNYLMFAHQAVLKIPDEFMDTSIRKIGSCLGYEINKGNHSDLYIKLLRTEIAMDLRKWQTYSQVVTKLDKLTEEEVAKQQEQKEALEKGEEVPEEEIIKDPEPYDVTETYCIEFENEGKAYEEFLLMFHDEYTEERVEKWKAKLHKLIPVLTNGEEVVEKIVSEMETNITFWKSLKEDPESQINNETLKEDPRFLEFTCQALQRVMDVGEKTDQEIVEIISSITLNEESLNDLEEEIKTTKDNLAEDMVQRRQNRFNLIEEKVKKIIGDSEEFNGVTQGELDQLFDEIKTELANSEQFKKSDHGTNKIQYFTQVSQFLFINSMITTLVKRRIFSYQHDSGLADYQNIQLLNFKDLITEVKNFRDDLKSERAQIREEMIEKMEMKKQQQQEEGQQPEAEGEGDVIPEEDDIEVPVKERIKSISQIINMLSRSAQYC